MDTPRRGFVKAVFAVLSGALAVAIGAPIIVAFLDPVRRRTVKGGAGPMRIGKVADLPVGVPRRLDVIDAHSDAWDRSDPKPIGAVWLVCREGGRVDAYSGTCPHLGCAVGFNANTGEFVCPCHDSAFALKDGERLKGPSPRGLDPLPVKVKDGEVEIEFKQFVQGIPSRRES
jgi:menaquinol-cytochrome c reductase iron-sulfur subunit